VGVSNSFIAQRYTFLAIFPIFYAKKNDCSGNAERLEILGKGTKSGCLVEQTVVSNFFGQIFLKKIYLFLQQYTHFNLFFFIYIFIYKKNFYAMK
jgi:hypothetical protein